MADYDKSEAQKSPGIIGYVTGKQPLKYSFWFVYFTPAIIMMISGAVFGVTKFNRGDDDFLLRLLIFLGFTAVSRIIGWVSVITCRNNTQRPPLKVVALLFIGIDILHKLTYWPFLIIMSFGTFQA